MADEMNDFGELRAQVAGLQSGHNELKQDISSVRGEVATLTRSMHEGFTGILNRIDSKFENKSATIWPPLAILTTVLLTIGGALYMPIRENANKHEVLIESLRGQMVPRVEHEQHWRDAIEAERRSEQAARDLSYLQGQLHPLKTP